MMDFKEMLRQVVEKNASDLFLKEGSLPFIRLDGAVTKIADEVVTEEFVEEVFEEVLGRGLAKERFEKNGEVDVAYAPSDIGRFRVNAYLGMGRKGFVFRYLVSDIPDFEELNLPGKILRSLSAKARGLILLTGVAGCGKSTTIAAMIEFLNRTERKHIVTIEDPIEYTFVEKKSLISQREVGLDTSDFATGLKHCVRQSPDVILIGEMRDRETMEAALNAAETGHLVLSTVHTVNATQTVERIINFFPPHQHDLIRLQLSLLVQGIISQRLLVRSDGPGRVPAMEILVSTPTVRELLEKGNTRHLYNAVREGAFYGTLTFNQSLKELHASGKISLETALQASDMPEELKLEMKGIHRGARPSELKMGS